VYLEEPRGFRDAERVAERITLLDKAEAARPLIEWAASLAKRREAVVPWFDPAEASVEARVLMVFEAPGPMTNADNARPGSGFISVDNDDMTAETVWRTRDEVGLDAGVVAWNMVPWYLGRASRKPTAAELHEGATELLSLMRQLPDLDTVLLSGLYAQKGWDRHLDKSLQRPAVRVIRTWHPSPLSMNQPGKRDEFRAAIREAATAP
jgi:uracil-DNA glycosylase